LDDEKMKWLKRIGVTELNPKFRYYVFVNGSIMLYSEEYLNKTPLEQIKQGYESLTPKLEGVVLN
jgi:hypothetical protein